MTRFTIIVLFVSYIFCSCDNQSSRKIEYRNNEPEIYKAMPGDREMDEAIAKAKATFHQFYLALKVTDTFKKDLTVKYSLDVRAETNGEVTKEHMWISHLEILHDSLFGLVANEPIWTKEVKLWQRIYVDTNKISDWFYVENDKLIGGYTIRVAYSNMNDSEKHQLEYDMGCRIE